MDCFREQARQLLREIADNELEYIKREGHAWAGTNGPYCNHDTPVRNSGHYLVMYSYLYAETKKPEYLDVVHTLADYLAQDNNYGSSNSIRHRKDYRFDQTNGLIGQAWTIEALVEAYSITGKDQYIHLARKIYSSQKFDADSSLWHVIDCNGDEGFDLTFNHQLWFAACASMLYEYTKEETIRDNISRFLDAADSQYFSVHDNGLIVHRLNYCLTEREKQINRELTRRRKFRSLIMQPVTTISNKMSHARQDASFLLGLEEGYHLFDLYGFAILKNNEFFSQHPIFSGVKLKAAVEYIKNCDNILDLEKPVGGAPFNKFAFAYNSPAFEYPFVAQSFSMIQSTELCNCLLEFQLSRTYDYEKHVFHNNVSDSATLTARSYELIRFLRNNTGA